MRLYGYTGQGKTQGLDLGFEDVLAIQIGGRKSSLGRFPEKCGKYKSYTRSTNKRNWFRRYHKKCIRQDYKKEIRQILEE